MLQCIIQTVLSFCTPSDFRWHSLFQCDFLVRSNCKRSNVWLGLKMFFTVGISSHYVESITASNRTTASSSNRYQTIPDLKQSSDMEIIPLHEHWPPTCPVNIHIYRELLSTSGQHSRYIVLMMTGSEMKEWSLKWRWRSWVCGLMMCVWCQKHPVPLSIVWVFSSKSLWFDDITSSFFALS